MRSTPAIDAAAKPLGRPMSFDRNAVVEMAMNMFWKRGFHDVSLNEIAKEAGLTRASLYNTFDSKEALFLEAVERYCQASPEAALAHVPDTVTVEEALRELFRTAGRAMAADTERRGCLAINSANELMASGGEVGKALLAHFKGRRNTMQGLIERAVRAKELPAGTDVQLTADLILTFQSGLSVFSKSGASEASLNELCLAFLEQLGFGHAAAKKRSTYVRPARSS